MHELSFISSPLNWGWEKNPIIIIVLVSLDSLSVMCEVKKSKHYFDLCVYSLVSLNLIVVLK